MGALPAISRCARQRPASELGVRFRIGNSAGVGLRAVACIANVVEARRPGCGGVFRSARSRDC